MDDLVKNEIKKTSKKAMGSFALWGIGAALICCGGPLVLLAIASGTAAGLFGVLFSNFYIITLGVLISLLAIAWFSVNVFRSRNRKSK